eukprot:gene41222-6534_t
MSGAYDGDWGEAMDFEGEVCLTGAMTGRTESGTARSSRHSSVGPGPIEGDCR